MQMRLRLLRRRATTGRRGRYSKPVQLRNIHLRPAAPRARHAAQSLHRNQSPYPSHARHRRTGDRSALPGLLILVALVLTATSGAVLLARATHRPPAAATGHGRPPDGGGAATGPAPTTAATRAPGAGRPADALAGWAAPLASRLDIPAVALQAYGYAEIVSAAQQPSCQLRWTTLAGIGRIESNHGRAQATLGADGRAVPPIIGPTLDGRDGRLRVPDTDGGQLDHDPVADHAVGPMQFLPQTWRGWASDADGDGVTDPDDIDDAALSAARSLCSGGRTLSTADGWWAAILSYNAVQAYAHNIFTDADSYGRQSRG